MSSARDRIRQSIHEAIEQTVSEFPPLSDEQVRRVSALLTSASTSPTSRKAAA